MLQPTVKKEQGENSVSNKAEIVMKKDQIDEPGSGEIVMKIQYETKMIILKNMSMN
jgi:hypothetical protein